MEFNDPKPSPPSVVMFWKLVSACGMLFRGVFIALIGFIAWQWLDPRSLLDTPLSELTAREIARNFLAAMIALGCVKWFFAFPERFASERPRESPYVVWAKFGTYAIICGGSVVYVLFK